MLFTGPEMGLIRFFGRLGALGALGTLGTLRALGTLRTLSFRDLVILWWLYG